MSTEYNDAPKHMRRAVETREAPAEPGECSTRPPLGHDARKSPLDRPRGLSTSGGTMDALQNPVLNWIVTADEASDEPGEEFESFSPGRGMTKGRRPSVRESGLRELERSSARPRTTAGLPTSRTRKPRPWSPPRAPRSCAPTRSGSWRAPSGHWRKRSTGSRAASARRGSKVRTTSAT